MTTLREYFWPCPPEKISEESKAAVAADIQQNFRPAGPLGEADLETVNIWVRHKDNQARRTNREWLRPLAGKLACRWGWLSAVSWILSYLTSGHLLFEVPLTIIGFISGVVTFGLVYAHRSLNKEESY